MHNLPFDKPGRFWKGNIHTHSDRSDGSMPVDQLIETYRSQCYDFLAVTDHFMERFGYPIVDTRSARSEHFTTILGAELHAPACSTASRGTCSPSDSPSSSTHQSQERTVRPWLGGPSMPERSSQSPIPAGTP